MAVNIMKMEMIRYRCLLTKEHRRESHSSPMKPVDEAANLQKRQWTEEQGSGKSQTVGSYSPTASKDNARKEKDGEVKRDLQHIPNFKKE